MGTNNLWRSLCRQKLTNYDILANVDKTALYAYGKDSITAKFYAGSTIALYVNMDACLRIMECLTDSLLTVNLDKTKFYA